MARARARVSRGCCCCWNGLRALSRLPVRLYAHEQTEISHGLDQRHIHSVRRLRVAADMGVRVFLQPFFTPLFFYTRI